jgi:hypothetical protein
MDNKQATFDNTEEDSEDSKEEASEVSQNVAFELAPLD